VLGDAPWVPWLLDLEEQERGRRGLDRRVKHAKLGAFKPLADFDWAWPTLDRSQVEALGLHQSFSGHQISSRRSPQHVRPRTRPVHGQTQA
jgi:hypothetical protein